MDVDAALCKGGRVSDEALDAAWTEVLARWDDREAHSRFIALCDVLGRLDEAGARYRAIREGEPERADEAARGIEQVVGRALVNLHGQRAAAPAKRNRSTLLFVAIAVFLAILGTTMWMIADLGSW